MFKGPPKKNKKQGTKKQPQKTSPTGFPFFLLLFQVPLASAVGRLWTCHRMWAPAAGCGVFLYELVPSDGPFMWCLYETFFWADFFNFSQRTFFFSSEQ
jgi:hypothetical protein